MKNLIALLTTGLVCNLLFMAPLPAVDFTGLESADVVYEFGKVDLVNAKDRYLIVDDSRYVLGPSVQIYSESGAVLNLSSLRRGTRIAFAVEGKSGASARTIAAIKISPGK